MSKAKFKGLLTDKQIENLAPTAKQYRVSDGNKLSLLVMPTGSKLWRFRFKFEGREQNMSLGIYPGVSLQKARELCEEERVKLRNTKQNPMQVKKAVTAGYKNTVDSLATEWQNKLRHLTASSMLAIQNRYEKWVKPEIGTRPIDAVTPMDIYALLQIIEKQEKYEAMNAVRKELKRMFSLAMLTGRAKFNPASDLGEALGKRATTPIAAIIEPKAFGGLLNAIDRYRGYATTTIALRMMPHLMTRPKEMRAGQWSEIDWDNAQWNIPASRMKKRRDHAVPLSRQVLSMLKELHTLTGTQTLMFPQDKDPTKHLADRTVNRALAFMGYQGKHAAHGFRSSASSMLTVMGFNSDAIELQLAHKIPGVKGIYMRDQLIDQRRKMMQAWSDAIDEMKRGGKPTQQKPKLRLVA
jgi:integrase